jgi:integrase
MTVLFDASGRRRSPVTMPGYHAGRPPGNKGMRNPADPPTVDEIVAVLRHSPDNRHGWRIRAMIVVLWRAGPRVQEALALAEHDIHQRRGSLPVRRGKGGRRREVGMDEWAWELLRPLAHGAGGAAARAAVLHHRRRDTRAGTVGQRRTRALTRTTPMTSGSAARRSRSSLAKRVSGRERLRAARLVRLSSDAAPARSNANRALR